MPNYITPDKLVSPETPSANATIDKTTKTIDQISTLMDKGEKLLDKIMTLKKNKTPDQGGTMNQFIENKANKMATQQMQQQPPQNEIIYREPKFNYQGMAESLVKTLGDLVEKDEKKTVKDYYELEVLKLHEAKLLPSVIEQWLKEYIEND